MRTLTALAVLAVAVLIAVPISAQQVQIEAERTPPTPEARVVPPPLHYETTRPPDADFYPRGTVVEHDPAFIEPLARKYQDANGSGRYGLAGWTSPNIPVASPVAGFRESPGWFAFGFAVTWDGPPAPTAGGPARRPAR